MVDKKSIQYMKLKDISIKKPEYGSGSKASIFDSTLPRYVRITDIDENGNLKNENKVSPDLIEEKYFLEENDLLFARSGSVGKTYLYNEEDGLCQFAGYLIRFKINPEIVIPKYVFLFTKSPFYWSWVESQKVTMTISNINAKKYSELEIPIFSLDIQKKIVEKLEKIEDLICYRDESIKLLILFLENLFVEYFGDLRLNDKRWECAELKDVSTIIMGQSPSGDSYNNEGIGKEFFQGKAEFGEMYPTVKKWTTEPKRIAKKGSILFSVRAPVGSVNIANIECCIGRGLAAIESGDKLNNLYLFYYFKIIEDTIASRGTGSTFKSINKSQLSSLKVPVPPIELQNQFAEIVQQVEELKKYQFESKLELENLFNNLMQKAFKGD